MFNLYSDHNLKSSWKKSTLIERIGVIFIALMLLLCILCVPLASFLDSRSDDSSFSRSVASRSVSTSSDNSFISRTVSDVNIPCTVDFYSNGSNSSSLYGVFVTSITARYSYDVSISSTSVDFVFFDYHLILYRSLTSSAIFHPLNLYLDNVSQPVGAFQISLTSAEPSSHEFIIDFNTSSILYRLTFKYNTTVLPNNVIGFPLFRYSSTTYPEGNWKYETTFSYSYSINSLPLKSTIILGSFWSRYIPTFADPYILSYLKSVPFLTPYGVSALSSSFFAEGVNDYYSGVEYGYNNGYSAGFSDGKSQGYDNGYGIGYGRGQSEGYNQGFSAGVASANDYTFLGLFGAVIDAPIKAFAGLFNFTVLGVDMAPFLLSLLTICIVIKIVHLLI